jgi:hypothetical protein
VFVARKEITDPVQLKGKKIAVNSLVGSAILAFKITGSQGSMGSQDS